MLTDGLKVSPMDDQQAIAQLMKQNPRLYALDANEQLFASMARGMIANPGGMFVCNFEGMPSSHCSGGSWAGCYYNEGTRSVGIRVDGHSGSPAEDRHPLVVHVNGPAKNQIPRGHGCEQALAQAFDRLSL